MSLVSALIDRHFALSDSELRLGHVSVKEVAEEYGTPLFVYDRNVLDRKFSLLRDALPSQFSISYSVKANPNRTLLQYFLDKGCGLEVASAGEFYLALSAGCPPSKVLFAGPGKTEGELEHVLREDIGEIHIESRLEAERIAAIARRNNTRARVALRVNPTSDAQGGAMRMGGKAAPFGIDEEEVDTLLAVILGESSLEFNGIHIFSGTQILDVDVLIGQYRKGLDIARRLAGQLGRPLRTVDFGGGLGIPYFPNDHELDMSAVRQKVGILMTEMRDDPLFLGTQFIVEPGRYLVGEAGIYVTRIIDIKGSRQKKFLITDGGMNHHLAASGNLGQVIKRNFPIALVNRLKGPAVDLVDVVGPLCTPLDALAREAHLPVAEVGDLVGIFQSGAYARSASPLSFLSHPSPPEVMVSDNKIKLIRRRGTLADLAADLIP